MHTFVSLLTVALAATSALAIHTPTQTQKRTLALNPDVSVARPLVQLTGRDTATNARRFAAGLPPVSPRARSHKAARAAPSGTPSTNTGYIQVTGSDNTVYGYLSTTLNTFGEYGQFTEDPASALKIAFDSTSATNLDLTASNSFFTDLPFLGGTAGFSSTSASIASDSADYVFLTATTLTTTLSAPVQVENSFTRQTGIDKESLSAIWEFANGIITPQWVNEDSSRPTTIAVYVPSEEAIALVGDVATFESTYGVTVVSLTFTFVSA